MYSIRAVEENRVPDILEHFIYTQSSFIYIQHMAWVQHICNLNYVHASLSYVSYVLYICRVYLRIPIIQVSYLYHDRRMKIQSAC